MSLRQWGEAEEKPKWNSLAQDFMPLPAYISLRRCIQGNLNIKRIGKYPCYLHLIPQKSFRKKHFSETFSFLRIKPAHLVLTFASENKSKGCHIDEAKKLESIIDLLKLVVKWDGTMMKARTWGALHELVVQTPERRNCTCLKMLLSASRHGAGLTSWLTTVAGS